MPLVGVRCAGTTCATPTARCWQPTALLVTIQAVMGHSVPPTDVNPADTREHSAQTGTASRAPHRPPQRLRQAAHDAWMAALGELEEVARMEAELEGEP